MSADPSLLVHSLLDLSTLSSEERLFGTNILLVVDNVLEVIDEYHAKINKFERSILLKPQMETVRHSACLLSYVCPRPSPNSDSKSIFFLVT
jgi:hypothetical protein